MVLSRIEPRAAQHGRTWPGEKPLELIMGLNLQYGGLMDGKLPSDSDLCRDRPIIVKLA